MTALDFAGNVSERSDILDVRPLNISSPTPPTNLRVSGQHNLTLSRLEMVFSWTTPNVSNDDRQSAGRFRFFYLLLSFIHRESPPRQQPTKISVDISFAMLKLSAP